MKILNLEDKGFYQTKTKWVAGKLLIVEKEKAKAFKSFYQKMTKCQSNDADRPMFYGILLNASDKEAVVTDGKILRVEPATETVQELLSLFCTKKSRCLIRFSPLKVKNGVVVDVNGLPAVEVGQGAIAYTVLDIDAEFPQYQEILPKDIMQRIKFNSVKELKEIHALIKQERTPREVKDAFACIIERDKEIYIVFTRLIQGIKYFCKRKLDAVPFRTEEEILKGGITLRTEYLIMAVENNSVLRLTGTYKVIETQNSSGETVLFMPARNTEELVDYFNTGTVPERAKDEKEIPETGLM